MSGVVHRFHDGLTGLRVDLRELLFLPSLGVEPLDDVTLAVLVVIGRVAMGNLVVFIPVPVVDPFVLSLGETPGELQAGEGVVTCDGNVGEHDLVSVDLRVVPASLV